MNLQAAEQLDSAELLSAQSLLNRAQTLQRQRIYAESIPLAQQSLAIYEKFTGAASLETAAALDLLGRAYRFTGDFARAESLIMRALAIREKILGREHPLTANSLNNLGGVYVSTYAYSRAEETYQRVLDIREKVLGLSHTDTAISLNNLALVYVSTGRYARAQVLYQKALEIYERVSGPDSLDAADTLANLAHTYERTGDGNRAESLFERALAVTERILGPEHPSVATEIENIARMQYLSGAYERAVAGQLRALAIREKTQGAEHPDVAATLQGLGDLYADLGRYVEAEQVYLRAIDIREKRLGPNNLAMAYVLTDLAEVYLATGSYPKAQALLERALAIKEKVGSLNDSYANSLHDLARLAPHLNEFARATAYFERALSIRESVLGSQHPRTAETLIAFATFEWARGESDKALPLLKRARVIQTENSKPFLLSGSESRRLAYVKMLSNDTYKYVSYALATRSREGALLGLDSVLQYKGRVLDAMSGSVARLHESMNREDRVLFEQLTEVAGQISALTYRGASGSIEYRNQIDALRARQEKLETQLSARSNAFRQQMTPITVAGVRRAIPSDAALIEWFRYTPVEPKNVITRDKASEVHPEPRYAAFVVKRNMDPVAIDIGDAKTIESMVRDYRVAVSDTKADRGNAATSLSRTLLQPLSAHIKGVNRLLMSPDGALNLVPMAALVDDHGAYLASQFEITYLTSGRDLLHAPTKSNSQSADIVVADANFGLPTYLVATSTVTPASQRSIEMDRGGLVFRPLANTELEAQDLKNILNLPSTSLLLHDDATEANLRKLHGPRILHIASHGFFLNDQELSTDMRKRNSSGEWAASADENPLVRSGIALSGANARRSGESDDGILTALEAAHLDLHGTELVVLSACDTGVGEVMNGEGVYGLRRALVLAGAETQVTSLWKVSDEATRKLMADYYRRLLKGEGRSAALRHAQLDTLATPEYSNPYYWASFVSIGSWQPLSKLH